MISLNSLRCLKCRSYQQLRISKTRLDVFYPSSIWMMDTKYDELIAESIRIARGLLIDEHKEHFIGIYLDQNKNIIKGEIISIGTLTTTVVHPRETFKPALAMQARYVIVLHNHPSGNVTPTPSDIRVTRQLIKAGEILGVEVIRHVIFSCIVRFSEVEVNDKFSYMGSLKQ